MPLASTRPGPRPVPEPVDRDPPGSNPGALIAEASLSETHSGQVDTADG